MNEKDNDIDIDENNNREIVTEDNNFDSKTHDNKKEITRLNSSMIQVNERTLIWDWETY